MNQCEMCEHNKKGEWCEECDFKLKKPTQESHKQTNYEKIMSEMTPDKLAELMVEHDWQYDDCGVITTYKTSFEDRWYYSQEENAIDDQLEWLSKEVEE